MSLIKMVFLNRLLSYLKKDRTVTFNTIFLKREITQKSGSSFIVAFKNSLNESLHAFVDTFRLIPQLFQKNENTIA